MKDGAYSNLNALWLRMKCIFRKRICEKGIHYMTMSNDVIAYVRILEISQLFMLPSTDYPLQWSGFATFQCEKY